MEKTITVRQLNLYVRSLLDGDAKLANISVVGEISNLKNHYTSGHIYFSLKDNDALIRCVMFKMNAVRNNFSLKDGDKVICSGNVTLYEKDGQFQFIAEKILPYGSGDLFREFNLIKERLSAEGLFDSKFKKELPKFPKNIAVVTSLSGAALQDVINIISRRYPICKLTVYSVLVQGNSSADSIIKTLRNISRDNSADVIILGRGGGSIEDLWSFNDEKLARTIFDLTIPVVSAVGHETDFTICDFVADLRAPTPSAAAELVVPDINELFETLNYYNRRLKDGLNLKYSTKKFEFVKFSQLFYKSSMDKLILKRQQTINYLSSKMIVSLKEKLSDNILRFNTAVTALDSVSPLKTLARGFSVVEKNNKQISSVKDIYVNDMVKVILKDGKFNAIVTEQNKE